MAGLQVQGEVRAAIANAEAENAQLICRYREQEKVIRDLKMKQLKVLGTKHLEQGDIRYVEMRTQERETKLQQRIRIRTEKKLELEEVLRVKNEGLKQLEKKEIKLKQSVKIEQNRNAAVTIRLKKKLQELEAKRDTLKTQFLQDSQQC